MPWVLPCAGRVTSPWGPRILKGAMFPFHYGVDVGAGRGPVFAVDAGVVRKIFITSKGGWVVDILHAAEGGRELRTRYIHMFREEIRVRVGDTVARGQWIGNSGESGSKGRPHLHFEVMVSGQLVDPVVFLGARGLALGRPGTSPPTQVASIAAGTTVEPEPEPEAEPFDPEDDMTPEQDNLLKHAVAMASEARGLAAHANALLASLPAAVAKAALWETTVSRNVGGVDRKIPVIQEIADIKTQVLGLTPVDLAIEVDELAMVAALAPLLPQVVSKLSDTDLLTIGAAVANEHLRRATD